MTSIAIVGFGPARTWARPGSSVTVAAVLHAAEPCSVRASVSLLDVGGLIERHEIELRLTAAPQTLDVSFVLPTTPRRGYGLRLTLEAGESASVATSAVEAIDGWWESPRHAAMTGYEDRAAAEDAVRELASWHVTTMQHYDWMWRHYQYLPPDGARIFQDALDRRVSHGALAAAIDAGHEVGIASLAYGSVYGAEPEYVDEHPDERVFDDTGTPLSLGGAFYINDLRPGSPWRERLLGEYVAALEAFPFDGIHMDTYGPPHTATSADGAILDFALLYPGLIDEAAGRVAAVRSSSRVLFNCVEGFPLDAIAPAAASCLYLELWPPDRSFSDVVRWIDRARSLADGRQVVIAAYAATLRDEVPLEARAEAFEAVLLLAAVITAAGGYHHTLADGDRLLVEGYYPAAVPMQPGEIDTLRALWQFSARYVHLLSAPQLALLDPDGLTLTDAHGQEVDWSLEPCADSIWVRASRLGDGRRVLNLVDLREQPDDYWDAPKSVAHAAVGLSIEWPGFRGPQAATPWPGDGDAERLEAAGPSWLVPDFERWLLMVESAV